MSSYCFQDTAILGSWTHNFGSTVFIYPELSTGLKKLNKGLVINGSRVIEDTVASFSNT